MIRAGGAAPSAGSIEALCVLNATSHRSAEHLSSVRLSGGSQHPGLVLALCDALGMVIFLEWYALLARRVSFCSSTACVLPGMSRGTLEGVVTARDAWITNGLVCLVVSVFLGRFSPGTGAVCHQKWMSHGNGTFRQSLQVMLSWEFWDCKFKFLSIWYFLNVSRPNGHKLMFSMQFCTGLPCSSLLVSLCLLNCDLVLILCYTFSVIMITLKLYLVW